MKTRLLISPFLALTLAVLACSVPTPSVGTTPNGTTEPATGQPVSGGLIPSGMIIAEGDGTVTFYIYNAEGSLMGTMEAPSLTYSRRRGVFPISGTSQGLPSLVYYSGHPAYQLLSNNGDGEDLLVSFSSDITLTALTGVPARNVLAYSTNSFAGGDSNTILYVGSTDTISSSQYLSLNGDVIIPLFIETEGGDPAGVWFSKMAAVGDALFEVTHGLFHLDLTSLTVSEVAGSDDMVNVNLSPDAGWVAYRDGGTSAPFSLTIRQLSTGVSHTFPLLANHDQGAGDGVISPENQYVAWMEGNGNFIAMGLPGMTADFRSTLRFGTTGGTTLINFPASSFDSASGFQVAFIRPMGWLDEQTLIIQVSGTGNTPSAVLTVNLSGEIHFIANGDFVCFVYP